jgi:hypothetical protein
MAGICNACRHHLSIPHRFEALSHQSKVKLLFHPCKIVKIVLQTRHNLER